MTRKTNRLNRSKALDKVPVITGIDTAPEPATLPAPPAAWVRPPKGELHQRRPLTAQKRTASGVSDELSASTDYETTFGTSAPNRLDLANALAVAAAWSADIEQVKQWLVYARLQESTAWQYVFTRTDALQPVFEGAVTHNSEIASEFVSLARFFGAVHSAGLRAAQSRKANAKKKAKQSAQAPATTTPVARVTVTAASPAGETKPAA